VEVIRGGGKQGVLAKGWGELDGNRGTTAVVKGGGGEGGGWGRGGGEDVGEGWG